MDYSASSPLLHNPPTPDHNKVPGNGDGRAGLGRRWGWGGEKEEQVGAEAHRRRDCNRKVGGTGGAAGADAIAGPLLA